MTESTRLKVIRCPYCSRRYKYYIRHVLTVHVVSCQEVMGGGTIFQQVENDERVALHVASCPPCKEALKKEGGE